MEDRFSFFRKLLVFFLFGFVPLFALHFTSTRLIDLAAEKKQEQKTEAFKTNLMELAQKLSTERFYFDLFENFFHTAQLHKTKTPEKLQKVTSFFNQKYGTKVIAYFFDESGKMIKFPDSFPPNSFIIGKAWDILTETESYKSGDEKKLLKKLQILLGGECNSGFLKIKEGQLISLRKKGEKGFLFWKRYHKSKHAGILLLQLPANKTLTILKSHFNSRPNKIGLTFWPPNSQTPAFSSKEMVDSEFVKRLLENQATNFCEFKNRLWSMARTNSGIFLGSIHKDEVSEKKNISGTLNLISLIICCIFLSLLFSKDFNLQKAYISIGNKLAAIVMISIAIPLFGLLHAGTLSLEAHEKVLLSRIEKEQRQLLSSIEDEFSDERMKFEKTCTNIFASVSSGYDRNKLMQTANTLLKENFATRIELRGLDGEELLMVSKKGYFEGLEKSNDAFARFAIKNHLADRLSDEHITVKKLPDSALTGIFTSSDFGFAQILESPGRSNQFKFGENESYWYWNCFKSPRHPVAYLTVFQAKDLARENFLKSFISRESALSRQMGIFNSRNRTWLKKPPGMAKKAERLIEQAALEEKPLVERIRIGNDGYVAIAFPGIVLTPFNMVYFTSDEILVRQIENMSLALKIGICLIFIIALLISKVLSQSFLQPIKDLDAGLKAIQERDENPHVQISTGDEFGDLGKAFNQMVDDLKEMQLAKVVQESLFPGKQTRIPGYEIALVNKTATDLGGDYCDLIPLPDGKWLILIGDVSGHGTPAALAMAMVKAAIFKACRSDFSFTELPEKISDLMLKTLNKKKMMTMLFALLDPDKNKVRFINAGHNWPIIINPKGSINEIQLVGLPLGIARTRRERKEEEIFLEPQDQIFVYTDALIEGMSPEKVIFGHERLYSELQQTKNPPPAMLLKNLETIWLRHLNGHAQEDDLTMLAIKRCKEKTTA